MAKVFDLRKQLKLHDKELLRKLFAEQGAMGRVPWHTLGQGDVEPMVEAWERLGDVRRHFQIVLQDVHQLTEPEGQKVLIQEVDWRYREQLPALLELKGAADRALWAYLECREAFHQAAMFTRAETLRHGQFANRWNSLPKQSVTVTPEKIRTLQEQIRSFYWRKEMRGEICRVHHYSRAGGSEFFFAYLPDWPDKRLTFDQEGDLTACEETYAFSNVFVYEPSAGAVELIAKGGQKVHQPLRQAFCRSILGVEVDQAQPLRPAYQLDHLLDPSFQFTADDGDRIAGVRLRRLRLLPRSESSTVEYWEARFSEQASRSDILQVVQRLLGAYDLDRSQVSVSHAGIQLQFLDDDKRRPRTLMFTVATPSSCDLKSKPDDLRLVGERCLQRWGILCA